MRIVIDNNGIVDTKTAMKMALQVVDRKDGVVKFTDGYSMEVKTAKTQKTFKVVLTPES